MLSEAVLLRRAFTGVDPNGYSSLGCWDAQSYTGKKTYTGSRKVTKDTCFAFCATAGDAVHYFGISQGSHCWCAEGYDGAEASADACSATCSGGGKGCGGPKKANVYVMYNCPKTPEEKAAVQAEIAAKEQARLDDVKRSYILRAGQTCGQGHPVRVQGQMTFVGQADDCKLSCGGELECGGFTYEEALTRCSFFGDTNAGAVQEGDLYECWVKTPGGV
jgi:hypothetical protein